MERLFWIGRDPSAAEMSWVLHEKYHVPLAVDLAMPKG